MGTNKLYETLLGIPLLSVTSVKIEPKTVEICCESKLASAHCPCCLKPCSKINQSYTRDIRDLSISGRTVSLSLTTRQFICKDCDRTFYEKFAFVDSYERMTIRYENFIYKRCIGVDLSYVGIQEDLEWHRVNRIFKKWSNRTIKEADLLGNVRAIGIDEIALKKGHKNFVCVLVNLETGEVLDVLEDRSKANLTLYFKALGESFCQGIRVFSADMWEGYTNVAKALFPNARIVVDRFHFFAHLQKALDNCRKALRRQFPDREELKNIKWLFLKNGFRAILEEKITPARADEKLTDWVIDILKKENKYLDKFVKTFTNWYRYILNYFDGRWSNGMVEGINNRIKMIKRRAFGYEDFGSFRNRVLVEFL